MCILPLAVGTRSYGEMDARLHESHLCQFALCAAAGRSSRKTVKHGVRDENPMNFGINICIIAHVMYMRSYGETGPEERMQDLRAI
jgi:hypothetical protein